MKKHCRSSLWTKSIDCHGNKPWMLLWETTLSSKNTAEHKPVTVDIQWQNTATKSWAIQSTKLLSCSWRCASWTSKPVPISPKMQPVMEGHCFARAKIEKLRAQYLENEPQWSDCVMEVIRASEAGGTNTKDIIQFLPKLCDHMDARFPVGDLKEWSAFQ